MGTNYGAMSTNFGPLARTSNISYYGGSSSQSVLNPSLFYNNWTAEAVHANGQQLAVAEYTMLHPRGGIAYFHMLLDASGSTWKKVSSGDKRRVYKYLLKNFEHLVECGDTLLPNDVIYVWTFNKRTKLLCRVKRKKFHQQLDSIRAKYKEEFNDNEGNFEETRLYDAIATAMATIRAEHKVHKKADFFLVPFTDGMDNISETTSLDGMMENIDSVGRARLHTIFITANMPETSDLYKRLKSQEKEITHIDCLTTEPNDISMAFNSLRELIKAIIRLEIHQVAGSALRMSSRIAGYGANVPDVAENMMSALHARGPSMLDSLYQWRSLGPPT